MFQAEQNRSGNGLEAYTKRLSNSQKAMNTFFQPITCRTHALANKGMQVAVAVADWERSIWF
jgi:hypothetical protein